MLRKCLRMADRISPETRSKTMSRIRGKNTKPELRVRSLVHRLGYRFRLHRKDLPGKPDLVLPRHRKVIFVHGCFWHAHAGCVRATRPTSRVEFWDAKLNGNVARDAATALALTEAGWKVLTIWECELKDEVKLTKRLRRFLKTKAPAERGSAGAKQPRPTAEV